MAAVTENKDDIEEIVLFDGGIKKKIIRAGSGGKPPVRSKVKVHYTGTLESDGSKFDSSRDRNEPFEFEISRGRVIKAWDEGVATMKVGERAIFTCREDFAYGKKGSPPNIPGDATLVFDIELLSFGDSEKDVSDGDDEVTKILPKNCCSCCKLTTIGLLRVVVLIQTISWTIVIPSFNDTVTDFFNGNIPAATLYVVGLGVGSKVLRFFIAPVIGSLSDAIGRFYPMLFTLGCLVIGWLLILINVSHATLIIGAIFRGISDCFFVLLVATVTDLSSTETFAHEFGKVGALFGMGFLIGPPAGGIFGGINPMLPYVVSVILSVINVLVVSFFFPETLPQELRKPFRNGVLNPFAPFKIFSPSSSMVQDPKFLFTMTVSYAFFCFANSAYPIMLWFTKFQYGWDVKQNGLLMGFGGLNIVISQACCLGPLLKCWNEHILIRMVLIIELIRFTCYGLSLIPAIFFISIGLFSIANLSTPLYQSQLAKCVDSSYLLANCADSSKMGMLQGALGAVKTVADIFGPLAFGGLFSHFISESAPVKIPGAPFFAGSLCTLFAFIIALYAFKISANPEHALGCSRKSTLQSDETNSV